MGLDEQIQLVERRLGGATARLYSRVLELLSAATRGDTPTRDAIRKLIINLLCGAYHDYRAETLLPKGDLVEALRAIPHDDLAAFKIKKLIDAVLRGEFDEDDAEGTRWRERATRDRVRDTYLQVTPPRADKPVTLTPREGDVLLWVNRYIETYGRPPTTREIGDGVTLSRSRVSQVLRRMQDKSVMANIGGSRGWIPTKA